MLADLDLRGGERSGRLGHEATSGDGALPGRRECTHHHAISAGSGDSRLQRVSTFSIVLNDSRFSSCGSPMLQYRPSAARSHAPGVAHAARPQDGDRGNADRQEGLLETAAASEPGPEAAHSSPDHILIGGDEVVQVGAHALTLGQINALADYVESLDELQAISVADLQLGLELIGRHDHHHGGLGPDEEAELNRLFPKYQELAKRNDAHFAPPKDGVSPTVKGDTLFEISEAWLGDGWRYPHLHEANVDVIGPDPDKIEPGMRLVHPDGSR